MQIVMQTEGSGDNAVEVPIKRIQVRPGQDGDGNQIFIGLSFPLLKVILKHETSSNRHIEITWSNTKKVKTLDVNGKIIKDDKGKIVWGYERRKNAGVFKVRVIENKPRMLYLTNSSGRKVLDGNNQPILDYAKMSWLWGSDFQEIELHGMKRVEPSYGENHPIDREVVSEKRFETIDLVCRYLKQRSTKHRLEELANEIDALFKGHELFQEYTMVETAA